MPSWERRKEIVQADQEFKESLQANPFEGSAVVAALASVIRATEGVSEKVGPAKISSFILARLNQAHDAALNAPDSAFAQLFEMQKAGQEAAIRVLTAKPATKPTNTAVIDMSDPKSHRRGI